MMSQVIVMKDEEFDSWYSGPSQEEADAPAPLGLTQLKKYDCLNQICHSLGTPAEMQVSLRGIYGQSQTVMEGETEKSITVDENYLRQSITDPGRQVLKGFGDIMPPYKNLTEQELTEIIGYIKTLP
jgi:cytochrome c oxidase subunit 2